METCRHAHRHKDLHELDRYIWMRGNLLQAQTGNLFCLFASMVLHVVRGIDLAHSFLCFSLPCFTHSHHFHVFFFFKSMFTFALIHTLLLDWFIVPYSQEIDQIWRDSGVCECVCLIHTFGQRRGCMQSGLPCCTLLPLLRAFISTSDWCIAIHPSVMSAFIFVELPNAIAKDVSGWFHLICWHYHCNLSSKCVLWRV